jgi:hypothetical protein
MSEKIIITKHSTISMSEQEIIELAKSIPYHEIHTVGDAVYVDKQTLFLHDSQQYLHYDHLKKLNNKNII